MGESQEISEEDEVAESASGADRLVGDVSSPLNSEDFACGERWLDSPSGHCLASELQLPRKYKDQDQVSGSGTVTQGVAEPHPVVQTSMKSDVLGDGFHWRKYGQKVVKGNSYPWEFLYLKVYPLKQEIK